MNEQLAIYLWSISEQISATIMFIAIIGGTLLTLIHYVEFDEYANIIGVNKKNAWIPIVALLMLFSSQLIPKKQDLALMLAVPTIKSVVNSNEVNKISKVGNLYLDNLIKELESSK